MPAKVKKIDGYQVRTPEGVTAKETTKEKAEAQARLLHGVAHGWKPTGKKRKVGSQGEPGREICGNPAIGKSKMATMHRGEHVCRG